MNRLRPIAVVAASFILASAATAEILPSFSSSHCAWLATHVVLVTEGEKIDGKVEVLESWKGNLKKGDRLTIPELAEFASEKQRRVSNSYFEFKKPGANSKPKHVTGSRLVLFLKKSEDSGRTKWLPADEDMRISIAWIEDGRTYAFLQEVNPGPCKLVDAGMSERELRGEVETTARAQEALAEAAKQSDPAKLTAVVEFMHPDRYYLNDYLIEGLSRGRRHSLQAYRKALADSRLRLHHGKVLTAMGWHVGAEAGPELKKFLKGELAYWKEHGPVLKDGGWEAPRKWDQAEPLNHRYGLAHATVDALRLANYAEARDTIVAFRDLWQNLPQKRGWEVTETCDRALKTVR